MREPILSLTDSPETPSLFLSHSAIIWRKPGGGKRVEKEPLEFPSESPQRKKDLINPIGKAREERFDFSPPPFPLYRVNTKDVLENVFHLASLSFPPFSSFLFFPSLPFSNPSAFALVPISIELPYGKQFLLTIFYSIFSLYFAYFCFPFFFSIIRSGWELHFLHYRVYTRCLIRLVQRISLSERSIRSKTYEFPKRNISIEICIDKIISNDLINLIIFAGHLSFQFHWTVVKNGMDDRGLRVALPLNRWRDED